MFKILSKEQIRQEKTEFQDKILVCKDCSKEFMFTAREQEFFTKKGFHDPVRCKQCRIARRNRQGNNYNINSHRQMFEITCAKCGQRTQIPFKPLKGRPVYCRQCYQFLRAGRVTRGETAGIKGTNKHVGMGS